MKNRFFRFGLLLALISTLCILILIYVNTSSFRAYKRSVRYDELIDRLNKNTTGAETNLRRWVKDKNSHNFQSEVIGLLAQNQEILRHASEGSTYENLTFERNEDLTLQTRLKEAGISGQELSSAAEIFYKQEEIAASRSNDSSYVRADDIELKAAERQFEAALAKMNADINSLESHFETQAQASLSSTNLLSWGSIGLLALVLATGVLVMVRFYRRNDTLNREIKDRVSNQEAAVKGLSSFIESIASGNYNVDLQLDDSNLSTTLVSMRDKLRQSSEEDRKRNWSTSGLAQIGEILRANNASKEQLYDNIIRFVVKYTKSNQGGLFILNDDNEKVLDLVACYAFERKKFLKKEIEAGEGLVGQCFLEGERIYLKEVPREYVHITSGLGGANPNALLVVPLKVNEKVFGVLEIATFGQYESYEIELMEKLAESIASTISSVRVNESTRLLLERTQQQAEEMRSQEEEMRQNMEELEATQEEMRRKEKHIQHMLEEEQRRNDFNNKGRKTLIQLNKNTDVQEGNWDASLEAITFAVCNHFQITRCSVWLYDPRETRIICEKLYQADQNKYEKGLILSNKDYPAYFKAILSEETIQAADVYNHPATREFTSTYLMPLNIQSLLDVPFFAEGRLAGVICCENQGTPVQWHDDHTEFLKSCADLLSISLNASKVKETLQHLNDSQQALQTIIDNLPRAVFWKDKELRFQGCNKLFAQAAGLTSHKDLIGHTDFDMPWKEHAEAYREDDLRVMKTKEPRLNLEEKNVNSEGVESWVLTSKVPVQNEKGEVVAVLGMFEDITQRKKQEIEVQSKLLELEKLQKMIATKVK